MKIVTQEMIEARIREKWPDEPFEIVQYTRVSQPFTIRCLDCGKETRYSSFNNFINAKKTAWCLCHQSGNYAKHFQNQQKILSLIKENPTKDLVETYYDDSQQKYRVKVHCLTCGQIYDKSYQSYMNHPDCPYCENRQLLNTEGVKALLPAEFSLLEEYKDEKTKILIKHSCGFIWKTYPRHLISGAHGCPKCNRKRSKGEQKIGRWLEDNCFYYEEEKIFSWQSNTRTRYDFYVPSVNLVIEYMGRQHYEEAPGFCKDTLKERQERDALKKQEAAENGIHYLSISYLDFENIETILTKWFNDYS